jgi:two-component system, cell cycle sensor histidine kinase and response regulator CckA
VCDCVDITARSIGEPASTGAGTREIGRLAGGVAHDFNNLLTVITGYRELMLKGLSPDDGLYLNAQEIRKAGERGAGLTRQLLAFGRKQVVERKPLDVNALILDAERTLRRLIGEEIELTTALDPRLGRVLADAGEIQQIIMNLGLNARDAMPDGGKLAITTANVDGGENGITGVPMQHPAGTCSSPSRTGGRDG